MEQPQNLEQLRVTNTFQAARTACSALGRTSATFGCVSTTEVLWKSWETGRVLSDSGENIACKIARELDFDLLLTGHQHMAVEGIELSGTYAVLTPR